MLKGVDLAIGTTSRILPSSCRICKSLVEPAQTRSLSIVKGTKRQIRPRLSHVVSSTMQFVAEPPVQNIAGTVKDGLKTATKPKIIIAGAGIGGLVLAVGLLKKGFEVVVFERDVTAIRGEGKYRGPIQVQSNALAALQAIDSDVAAQIFEHGCTTGDRINGLCDGVDGRWYVKFDTFHPAVEKGLPVTRVISRLTLQNVLADAVEKIAGDSIVRNGCHVLDYEEIVDEATGQKKVVAILEDGSRHTGDVLIGADGIWSKIRTKLIGPTEPSFSGYTCYTGISDFTPPDIDTVAYRVFLGNGKYFVSSDVGGGKMQWYGFNKEPPGGKDEEGHKKDRLLSIFSNWTDMVTDLIRATPEEDVLRRDIFDRPPIYNWTQGRVALLGDSAHAMQPNLGQGGCMAIEDAYLLVSMLTGAAEKGAANGGNIDWESTLKGYRNKRLFRASAIHGLAGFAAIMATTYKAYMGEGLGSFGDWLLQFKIPHFGKVGGKFWMEATMPGMLSWVLGGNADQISYGDRVPFCNLADLPKGFPEKDFQRLLESDDDLLHAARARWLLMPESLAQSNSESIYGRLPSDGQPSPVEGTCSVICSEGLTVGSGASASVTVECPSVSEEHAKIEQRGQDYYLTPKGKTWVNGDALTEGAAVRLWPGDVLDFGKVDEANRYRVKMCHESVFEKMMAAA